MVKYEIHTDGSCSRNGAYSIGGYGCAIINLRTKDVTYLSGCISEGVVTNQRAELIAAIKALESLSEPSKVILYSDSRYLVNTMYRGWKRKANKDLWAILDTLAEKHRILWFWEKGHSDNSYNIVCDLLASRAVKEYRG